jgi:hypothetical protein
MQAAACTERMSSAIADSRNACAYLPKKNVLINGSRLAIYNRDEVQNLAKQKTNASVPCQIIPNLLVR